MTLLFFATCGLEDYPHIYPIAQSNVTTEFNYRATVYIPNANSSTEFTHLLIFYRIYVSNSPQSAPTPGVFSTINPVLAQDYNSISPYIDSDTLVNTNMDGLFSGRGYKYLSLAGHNIEDVLSKDPSPYPNILGKTLIFDFPTGLDPTLTIDGAVYTLWRSNGNGTFSPEPDRLFRNKNDLWDPAKINSPINADVVDFTTGTIATHYTFAAMFIVAAGLDQNTWSYIYSTPSLIHVFQLQN